jgi:hypothetical protein
LEVGIAKNLLTALTTLTALTEIFCPLPFCLLLRFARDQRSKKAHGKQAGTRFWSARSTRSTHFLADFKTMRTRHSLKYWFSDSKNEQKCRIGGVICMLFRTFAPQF